MKNRLRKNEKAAISTLMKGNLIWDALQNPTRGYERELRHLKLCSEEVLLECLTLIDEVKENPKQASFSMQSLWDREYCDLRDLDLGDAEEDELALGASIIVYAVMLLLSMCNGTYYNRLTTLLIGQICQDGNDIFDRLQMDFMKNVWRLGEERLKLYVGDYMNSDEQWLSDDLVERLNELPKMTIVIGDDRKTESDAKKTEMLTNRQLIIFFEQTLNIPLSPEYTNQSALAKLISRVSGNSPGSIRQKIRDGIDYDDENVRRDVEVLISLIEPISPTIAERMRNCIE